jgi:hypothetical protein
MQKIRIILGMCILSSLYNCKSASKERLESTAIADTTTNTSITSSAAVEKNQDTTRKFIRTADLKFKVKSVIKSTYDIENITNRQGGFVTYTNLSSNVDRVSITTVSSDSSIESTYYTVTNTVTLRVPNTKLDTTLREIGRNIDYLDYRVIKAEDVALKFLSNRLAQRRSVKSEERLVNAIENRGKKLNETTNAEELLESKQEQSDNARISNLSLNDQIEFSTVNLIIYQRQTVKRELISNDKNIEEYKPSFGHKIIESLKFGWNILEAIVVFLIKLWGILLLGIVVIVIYKRYGHKFKK